MQNRKCIRLLDELGFTQITDTIWSYNGFIINYYNKNNYVTINVGDYNEMLYITNELKQSIINAMDRIATIRRLYDKD